MPFKVVLIIALLAQIGAACLAFRLNLRYRVYSAWLLISAAAFTIAALRFATLVDIWDEPPTIAGNYLLWATTLTSLLASLFLLGGMALIEPFFQQLARAQDTLQQAHLRLQTAMQETEEELQLARTIQQDLLPKSAPEAPGLEVAGESRPAVWTSGDYFDYVPLENGATLFVVADASGHGLGPALLMSATRASIRALARTLDDVGELLTQTNAAVSDAVSGRGFVTAFAARIDRGHDEFHYAAAGHTGYLLKSDGTRCDLSSDAPPLGVLPDATLDTHHGPRLQPGDILILVTDGILETVDDRGQMFGEEGLFGSVDQHRDSSADEIVAALFAAARRFAGGKPQSDDNTAVIVKVGAEVLQAASRSRA